MDVLERIINSSQTSSKNTQTYSCEKNRINQFYDYLRENLSGQELKTLEKLIKSQNKVLEIETMRFFVNGFKLGMSFAIETLN